MKYSDLKIGMIVTHRSKRTNAIYTMKVISSVRAIITDIDLSEAINSHPHVIMTKGQMWRIEGDYDYELVNKTVDYDIF